MPQEKEMGNLIGRISVFTILAWLVLYCPADSFSPAPDELDYLGAYGDGPWVGIDTSDISVITNGPRNLGKVALTFDDGPFEATNKILDTLAKYDVKATFFLVGSQVEKFPKIAKRIAAEGHQIGTHTYSHKKLDSLTSVRWKEEIDLGIVVIEDITGVRPTVFRPPYRLYDDEILSYVRGNGITMVLWDVDPGDWGVKNSGPVHYRVMHDISSGSIIPLHDLSPGTRKDLPRIIESIHSRGYDFVTVDRLIEELAVSKAVREVEND